MNINSRIRTKCIVCREPIHFSLPPKKGEIINCDYCGEKMEVINLNPIILDWPYEFESVMENYYLEEDHGY